ncbi:Rne/Rng family ribonuclease [Metaclostridioides mangenotii]|uniref:Rne/Rng family ribonuclease n=1 Tax=Metaclostridioides mangenotii TaxID=1540 RepID=UPI0026EB8019|nr:Rne/Rng family ribonuclease [Clostridioides mangenotii]
MKSLKSIIIETLTTSQKTAVTSDNKLLDFFIDDNDREKNVSNIYRGVVKKVLNGIDACFVDIGLEKLAYLQLDNGSEIKSGSDVLVQVNKEEVGTKGAKLSLEISVAGRYLVYIPANTRVTMSSKIRDEKEIVRLKKLVKEANVENLGLIIRTEAQGCTIEDLQKDIYELKYKYSEILKEYKLGIGPKLLYKSESSAVKYINDNLSEEIEKIVTDNVDTYEEVKVKLKSIDKKFIEKLVLEEDENVFELHRVDDKINKLFDKKVWLKSGGYIVVDRTEAMTVVDVNTGKFTKSAKLSDTILKTNLEAASEIAYQLRIRDISGIVVIDFIDMKSSKEKYEVLRVLDESLKSDRRKSEVLGMTRLGLVEVARRREKSSIDSYYLMDCKTCNSLNSLKSIKYVIDKIEREIRRTKKHTVYKDVSVEVNSSVFRVITEEYLNIIENISKKYSIKITLLENHRIEHENIHVVFIKNS